MMIVSCHGAGLGRAWRISGWMVYLEAAIQSFVLCIIAFGWYLSVFHVGGELTTYQVDWLIRRQELYTLGAIYLLSINGLVASVAGLYLYLSSGRHTHNIANYPLPDKSLLTEPYTCLNETGDVAVCNKGQCNGKWKPPRTHHCSTCGVCRLQFDHHCPWVGNCITLSNLKAFCCMLFLLPIAFAVAVLPVFRILLSHIVLALEVSRQSEWANGIWWSWPGSWILCAGPFGRWIVGTILGFVILKNDRQGSRQELAGYLIEEPHLRVVLTAGFVMLLSLFTIFLAISSMKMILRGVTTLETLRRSEDFVCIPQQSSTNHPILALVLPNERPYDLGFACNWNSFITSPLVSKSIPRTYIWPKLNPTMVQRMRSSFQPNT